MSLDSGRYSRILFSPRKTFLLLVVFWRILPFTGLQESFKHPTGVLKAKQRASSELLRYPKPGED